MAGIISWGDMIVKLDLFERDFRAALPHYRVPSTPELGQVGPDAILGGVEKLLEKYPGDSLLLKDQARLKK